MKPILITSGEPAGVGPDLCLALAYYDLPVVILADLTLLQQRAKQLNKEIVFKEYQPGQSPEFKAGVLHVLHIPCSTEVVSGSLNVANSAYVLQMLTTAATLCAEQQFSALVTAPVHKAIINQAGIPFTGHTEFFADFYKINTVVMMLACESMRVALVTTHLPLKEVAAAISFELVIDVISQLNQSLINDFGIAKPIIKVAGLNPHAGESGYLGREELDIIIPALTALQQKGLSLTGPMPADTMFVKEHTNSCDAYVAMYHDQGLPVLKYAGFNQAVNVTLGLPIIRTSVDHGTALDLAGKNTVNSGSMLAAVKMAMNMAKNRDQL